MNVHLKAIWCLLFRPLLVVATMMLVVSSVRRRRRFAKAVRRHRRYRRRRCLAALAAADTSNFVAYVMQPFLVRQRPNVRLQQQP